MTFDLLVAAVSVLAGAVAAVSGFGIGSLLTPLLALRYETGLAVALVSVPHLVATALRFAALRRAVDREVLLRFGVLSAAGGLLGALLHARARGPALAIVFASLLLVAGASTLTGFADRMRLGPKTAWLAGALSGFFGGLVGNQGGIRSAALLAFDIRRDAFVATATAVGLIVDAARMPVYLATRHEGMREAASVVGWSVLGVVIGTFWGVRLLRRIPETAFRRAVAVLLLLLGLYMLWRGVRGGS